MGRLRGIICFFGLYETLARGGAFHGAACHCLIGLVLWGDETGEVILLRVVGDGRCGGWWCGWHFEVVGLDELANKGKDTICQAGCRDADLFHEFSHDGGVGVFFLFWF